MRRHRGFTFIELMFTMMFMSLTFFYIMDLYHSVVGRMQALEVLDTGVDLCTNAMEKIKNRRLNMDAMLKIKKESTEISFHEQRDAAGMEMGQRALNTRWRVETTFEPYVPGIGVVENNADQVVLIRVSAIRKVVSPGNVNNVLAEYNEFELATLYQDVKPQ